MLKAASTSICKALERGAKDVTIVHPSADHGARDGRINGWIGRDELMREASFTVCRDPYDRAISQHHHCIRLGHKYSMEEWLMKDFNDMAIKERLHSLRQIDYITSSYGVLPTITIKLEAKRLGKLISGLVGSEISLPHMARDDRRKPALTNNEITLINQKYYADFKHFKYDFRPDY